MPKAIIQPNNQDTFYIVFSNLPSSRHFFTNTDNELAIILRKYKGHGIQKIQRFESKNNGGFKFTSISKQLVRTLFGNNTDNQEELIKSGYLK